MTLLCTTTTTRPSLLPIRLAYSLPQASCYCTSENSPLLVLAEPSLTDGRVISSNNKNFCMERVENCITAASWLVHTLSVHAIYEHSTIWLIVPCDQERVPECGSRPPKPRWGERSFWSDRFHWFSWHDSKVLVLWRLAEEWAHLPPPQRSGRSHPSSAGEVFQWWRHWWEFEWLHHIGLVWTHVYRWLHGRTTLNA